MYFISSMCKIVCTLNVYLHHGEVIVQCMYTVQCEVYKATYVYNANNRLLKYILHMMFSEIIENKSFLYIA